MLSDDSSDPDFEVGHLLRNRHSLRVRRNRFVPEESEDEVPPSPPRKRAKPTPPQPTRRRNTRVRVTYPEDVPWLSPKPENPAPDPVDVAHSPSIAFLCIFVQTFADAFDGLIIGPSDLESGIKSDRPAEVVQSLFVKLLGLVLNRKKEVETTRYTSALQELHAQLGVLGVGTGFPPLAWKSKDAFAELLWDDRLELLHVLAHWTLSSSDRIREILATLDETATRPWIGITPTNSKWYMVHINRQFRLFKESSTYLSVVTWTPVAHNATELRQVINTLAPGILMDDVEEDQSNSTVVEAPDASGGPESAQNGQHSQQKAPSDSEADDKEGSQNPEQNSKGAGESAALETVKELDRDTKALAETLAEYLPKLEEEEREAAAQYARESKRRAKQAELERHVAYLRENGGRHRTRRTEIDFAAMFAEPELSDSDDDKSSRRKRRLRRRDDPWKFDGGESDEVRTESRQERYERLARDRASRVSVEPEASEESPQEDKTPTADEKGAIVYSNDVNQAVENPESSEQEILKSEDTATFSKPPSNLQHEPSSWLTSTERQAAEPMIATPSEPLAASNAWQRHEVLTHDQQSRPLSNPTSEAAYLASQRPVYQQEKLQHGPIQSLQSAVQTTEMPQVPNLVQNAAEGVGYLQNNQAQAPSQQ